MESEPKSQMIEFEDNQVYPWIYSYNGVLITSDNPDMTHERMGEDCGSDVISGGNFRNSKGEILFDFNMGSIVVVNNSNWKSDVKKAFEIKY